MKDPLCCGARWEIFPGQGVTKKLLLVLLLICCAISSSYLPSTQAIPVRRTTTPGHQRLILHSNVYRERYHQNLLRDQRHHQQQQQHLIQKHHQYQQQHKKQQQQQHQAQRPSSYLAPILRKVHHQLQHHHLHQRAAPTATTVTNQHKMSFCEKERVFRNLDAQMNMSLPFIKLLCDKLLRTREDKTFNEMKETWKLLKLEIRNPNRKKVNLDNELHQKMHDFYLNLHNFHQLVEFAHQDTIDNKNSIEHGEDIDSSIILEFFTKLKIEIKHNMAEAEKVLQGLSIEKPNLDENTIEFNRTIAGKLRDFLIVKEFVDEVETIAEMFKKYKSDCQPNGNGEE